MGAKWLFQLRSAPGQQVPPECKCTRRAHMPCTCLLRNGADFWEGCLSHLAFFGTTR